MRLSTSPEPALLGFMLDGPVHGYDLFKRVERNLGLVWSVGMSQVYAIVKTFEARGWIHTHRVLQATRPSQKVLELTPEGRRAFDEWLAQPAHGLREFRVDFFLRLYFARATGAPRDAARALVDGQMDACRRELEHLRTRRAEGTDGEEGDLYQLTRSFRIEQLETILGWMERHYAQLVPAKATHAGAKKPARVRQP